jgi:hypothetical protein
MTTVAGATTTVTGMSETATLFGVGPGVRYAIVRSADQRVELLGSLDLGFGRTFTDSSTTPPPMMMMGVTTTTGGFHFAYTVGPGLRYWIHPQFAMGVLAGVRGDYDTQTTTTTTTMGGNTATSSVNNTALIHSIITQLQFTGVF